MESNFKIEIGKYRIVRGDRLNLILQEKREIQFSKNPKLAEKQREELEEGQTEKGYDMGFHGDVPSALRRLLTYELAAEDVTSIETLLNKIDETYEKIKKAKWTITNNES